MNMDNYCHHIIELQVQQFMRTKNNFDTNSAYYDNTCQQNNLSEKTKHVKEVDVNK